LAKNILLTNCIDSIDANNDCAPNPNAANMAKFPIIKETVPNRLLNEAFSLSVLFGSFEL
jgi:hypothetical protein